MSHRLDYEYCEIFVRPPGPAHGVDDFAARADVFEFVATALSGSGVQAADTDWWLISDLYAQLEAMTTSPIVRLNRAVAVAQVNGPAAGLALLKGLAANLDRHHMSYAIRADLLRRVGREHDALQDYQRALDLCTNEIERSFPQREADRIPSSALSPRGSGCRCPASGRRRRGSAGGLAKGV